MRKFLTAANWKMNKTPDEGIKFLKEFIPLVDKSPHRDIALFPSTLGVMSVKQELQNRWILWGAQNSHYEKQGAFTGENSPAVLAQLGCHMVLVGHSERRTLFLESDELLSKKVKAVQLEGMIPMLCVGETLKERESGQTADIIRTQLKKGLSLADLHCAFVIAYEPVWAIGTGKVATPEQAEDAHRILRAELATLNPDVAQRVQILYGGSVTPQNSRELSALPNIDGFLVGGASLQPQSFAAIANIPL
jgi:triosephosphate isomerase (TIM)